MPNSRHISKRCCRSIRSIYFFFVGACVTYLATLLVINKKLSLNKDVSVHHNEKNERVLSNRVKEARKNGVSRNKGVFVLHNGKNEHATTHPSKKARNNTVFPHLHDGRESKSPFTSEASKRVLLPLPIILSMLPKSGTISISKFFKCNGLHMSHHYCRHNNTFHDFCGVIMKENLERGDPLFKNTGNFEVYGQIEDVDSCFFPMIHNLEKVHEEHPNATIILNLRNVDEWINSTIRWTVFNDVPMSMRIAKCNYTPEVLISGSNNNATDILDPHVELTDEIVYKKLRALYLGQAEQMRQFVKKYSSHKLVEVYIDRDDAGEILGREFFGIPDSEASKSCWQHMNKNHWNLPGEKIMTPKEIRAKIRENKAEKLLAKQKMKQKGVKKKEQKMEPKQKMKIKQKMKHKNVAKQPQ